MLRRQASGASSSSSSASSFASSPAPGRTGHGGLIEVLGCFNLWDYETPRLSEQFPPGRLALLFEHYSKRMLPQHQVKDSSPSLEAVARANRTLAFYEAVLFGRESGMTPDLISVGQLRFIFKSVHRNTRHWGDTSTLTGELSHADMSELAEELDYPQFEELLARCALVAFPDLPPRVCLKKLLDSLRFGDAGDIQITPGSEHEAGRSSGGRSSGGGPNLARRLRRWLMERDRELGTMGTVEVEALKRRMRQSLFEMGDDGGGGGGDDEGADMTKSGKLRGGGSDGNSASKAGKKFAFVRKGDAMRLDCESQRGTELIERLKLFDRSLLDDLVAFRIDLTARPNHRLRPFSKKESMDLGVMVQRQRRQQQGRGRGAAVQGEVKRRDQEDGDGGGDGDASVVVAKKNDGYDESDDSDDYGDDGRLVREAEMKGDEEEVQQQQQQQQESAQQRRQRGYIAAGARPPVDVEPLTASTGGRRKGQPPSSSVTKSLVRTFWVMVQNTHHREIVLDVDIAGGRGRSGGDDAGGDGDDDGEDGEGGGVGGEGGGGGGGGGGALLTAFEVEVGVRPIATGLTRQVKVYVDLTLAAELAATLRIVARTLDGRQVQTKTVPIRGTCVPGDIAADASSAPPRLYATAAAGPVLGASFIGRGAPERVLQQAADSYSRTDRPASTTAPPPLLHRSSSSSSSASPAPSSSSTASLRRGMMGSISGTNLVRLRAGQPLQRSTKK